MHYDHRASMVRGLVLEIMVHAAAGQMISLSNAARLPVDDQDLPHRSRNERVICAHIYASADILAHDWLNPISGYRRLYLSFSRNPDRRLCAGRASAPCEALSAQIPHVWAGAEGDVYEFRRRSWSGLAVLLAVAWLGMPVSWFAAERG
jgi:hypothetical protein